jgi:hypothetical protein
MKTLEQRETEIILQIAEENKHLRKTIAELYDLIEAMSEEGQELEKTKLGNGTLNLFDCFFVMVT